MAAEKGLVWDQWPSLDEIQDDSNYFIVGYP